MSKLCEIHTETRGYSALEVALHCAGEREGAKCSQCPGTSLSEKRLAGRVRDYNMTFENYNHAWVTWPLHSAILPTYNG